MEKKLYRSNRDKVLSGVCGGIAEYFAVDPTLIRLLWVLITVLGGAGLIGYIICIFVIPERPSYSSSNVDEYIVEAKNSEQYSNYHDFDDEYRKKSSEKNKLLVGILLVLFGGAFILRRFVWFDMGLLWSLLLVAGGAYIIYNHKKGKDID